LLDPIQLVGLVDSLGIALGLLLLAEGIAGSDAQVLPQRLFDAPLAEVTFNAVSIPEDAAVACPEANGKALVPFDGVILGRDVAAAPVTGADGALDDDFLIAADHELLLVWYAPAKQRRHHAAFAGGVLEKWPMNGAEKDSLYDNWCGPSVGNPLARTRATTHGPCAAMTR
jgi:hypothetical protein